MTPNQKAMCVTIILFVLIGIFFSNMIYNERDKTLSYHNFTCNINHYETCICKNFTYIDVPISTDTECRIYYELINETIVRANIDFILFLSFYFIFALPCIFCIVQKIIYRPKQIDYLTLN